ncbi:hypothetical protein SISSUDRAFT_1128259 [Sistotremastrum suecicum HHB10207 ss-3]|uniref:Uncharacterized protein n=1 Tax=Sistotremastrum suecicum HHB10207 ss-3 TaxID=1314776 RepID=A0A166E4U0_9AGAM|nr:hypothetical protein SISSUDRAFT_1128259 [Sistotremastrum suecicum HHB10207 ss-3]
MFNPLPTGTKKPMSSESLFTYRTLLVISAASVIVFGSTVADAHVNITLAERQASECLTTHTCVCGQPCTFQDCVSGPDVDVNDCTTLSDMLKAKTTIGFIAPSYTTVVETYGSCTFIFENQTPGILEYCWDDFANAGFNNAFSCLTPATTSSGGECGGSINGGDWLVIAEASLTT